MVEVAVSRWPLIAIASAPPAHSALTTLCRSTSSTRLTVGAGGACRWSGRSAAGASVSRTTAPGPVTGGQPGRRLLLLHPAQLARRCRPSAACWAAVTSRRSRSLCACRSSVRCLGRLDLVDQAGVGPGALGLGRDRLPVGDREQEPDQRPASASAARTRPRRRHGRLRTVRGPAAAAASAYPGSSGLREQLEQEVGREPLPVAGSGVGQRCSRGCPRASPHHADDLDHVEQRRDPVEDQSPPGQAPAGRVGPAVGGRAHRARAAASGTRAAG